MATPLLITSRLGYAVLELTPAPHPFDGAYAVVPTWEAKYTNLGVEGTLVCPEAEDPPASLADYFDELYENRQGWHDALTWEARHGLKLSATHDFINTVHLDVTLTFEGVNDPSWTLTGQLYMDPGFFGQMAVKSRERGAESLKLAAESLKPPEES